VSARALRNASGMLRIGVEARRLLAGTLFICMVLFGQQLYGRATSSARLDKAFAAPTDAANVVVVLDFVPERFHNERIAQYGVFAGRDGALNRIRLVNVSREGLADLAALAWVARIEPARPLPPRR